MRVHVENDIYISGDKYGFTVERKRIGTSGKSAGKESYEALGNYPNLKGALTGLVKFKLSESKATTLQELLIELKQIQADLEAKITI